MVREAVRKDLHDLLSLYLFLHEEAVHEDGHHLNNVWNTIIEDSNHHIIVNEIDGRIISSCVCIIIPNLTRNVRPYAFLENVVTHAEYQHKGYSRECLEYAKKLAIKNNCYKIMLLTGSKEDSTLSFYKNAGYNCTDKTAFIQWLE